MSEILNIEGDCHFRTFSLAKSKIDENGVLELSFSSEIKYLRDFGYEILSHDPQDVDLSLLNSGNQPLLLDHDPDDADKHIGVVESAWITGDKQGRAKVRFSIDPIKQGIINDIKNGIRSNVSVGYVLTGKTAIGIDNGKEIYRCSWKPYEISSVAIAADPTVGTNRNATITNEVIMTPEEIAAAEAAKQLELEKRSALQQPQPTVQIADAADAADVIDLCRKFGMEDKAAEFIRSKKSMHDVKEAVFMAVEKRNLQTPIFVPTPGPVIHEKKERTFSIGAAVRAATSGDWSQAGYEREMSQEWGKGSIRGGFTGNNFFLDPHMSVRAGAVGTANGGAELVGTTYMPQNLIELLYAKTLSSRLGVSKLLGLHGNARIPKITSGTTASWGAETTIAAESSLGTDKLDMTPNQLTAKSKFSRQLLTQGLPNIEALVTTDIYKQIALAVDTAIINGSGASNQPTGVLSQAGLAVIAAGANGGAATWTILNNLIKSVDAANALDGSLKFVGNPKVSAHLRTVVKDTNTAAVYLMGDADKLVGYDYLSSTIVPSNLVKGTSGAVCSPLIFGNWADVIVAQWGSIEFVVDPYTAGDTSEIVLRAYSFWDTDVRHVQSFAVVKDLLA